MLWDFTLLDATENKVLSLVYTTLCPAIDTTATTLSWRGVFIVGLLIILHSMLKMQFTARTIEGVAFFPSRIQGRR